MANMYTVTTPQLILATVLSALISAGSVVGYFQYKERQTTQETRRSLPEVQVTADDKCVIVTNFRNGDAYNCEDVDVVLREYNKKLAVNKPAPSEIEQP